MSSISRSASSTSPFKSTKKQPPTTPRSKPSTAISTQTPDKPSELLPRRARNRGVALSIKEIRKVAQGHRDECQNHQTDQIKTARRQIASWPEEAAANKSKKTLDGLAKLPDKHEMLAEFFDSLDSSIRLLRLKGSTSTFTNICPKIEYLTDRRFTYSHLAQMKFILPEAIEIKRVLTFDERTSCMKPDLHITLNVEGIECNGKSKSDSKNMHLRKAFRARLADYYKAHPEGDDVPEDTLPEPFNYYSKAEQDSGTVKSPSPSVTTETSTEISTEADEQKAAAASHLSPSFRKHFSQKFAKIETQSTHPASSQHPVLPVPNPCLNKTSSNEDTNLSPTPSPTKVSSKLSFSKKSSKFCDSSTCMPSSCLLESPRKEVNPTKNSDGSPSEVAGTQSTPAKLASTPARLMVVTPTLHPPKRCYMSPDDNSTESPIKLVRRPSRSRSLKFDTPKKNDIVEAEVDDSGTASVDDDVCDIFPESLLQSIREKERKAIEERNPAISQAKRRRQMIACLPKLFNMIHFLFQSMRRSVITKEELVHKMIASHSDIVDRGEVEEQLNLLLELVPEWISEKLSSGGDLLFCIDKMSSVESIRARLEEAK